MGREELAQTVGGLIRRRRKSLGFSQAELAVEIEMSVASISAWERGERQPGLDGLLRLSAVLRCQVSDFFPGQARDVDPDEAVEAKVVRLERQFSRLQGEIDDAFGRLRSDGLLPEIAA